MLIELNAIIGVGTSSSSQSTLSVTDVSPHVVVSAVIW